MQLNYKKTCLTILILIISTTSNAKDVSAEEQLSNLQNGRSLNFFGSRNHYFQLNDTIELYVNNVSPFDNPRSLHLNLLYYLFCSKKTI